MNKFKVGDMVRYIGDFDRDTDYARNYYPLVGEIGEIVKKVTDDDTGHIEYEIRFDHDDSMSWTYCNEKELEPLLLETVITCCGSRGYGKSATEAITMLETKTEYLQKELEKLEKKMEEKEMKNEVLELWYSRKQEQIKKEYEDLAEKLEKENELINAYKTLIDDFEKSMKDLYEQDDNQEQKIIKELYCDYSYKYGLNCDLVHDMFYEKYRDEMQERLNNLYKTYKEVNAQLSLSDNLDYQIETLINYGILDKKTKKMVD